MKRILFFLLFALVLYGCNRIPETDKRLAYFNDDRLVREGKNSFTTFEYPGGGMHHPVWSDNGTAVAFFDDSDENPGKDLVILDTATRSITVADRVGFSDYDVDFSPDASMVVYMKTTGSEIETWLFNRTTGEKHKLADLCTEPDWNPVMDLIACTDWTQDHGPQLTVVTPEGKAQFSLFFSNSVNGFAWSPDGETLAYTRSNPDLDVNADRDELWVIGSDGSDAHKVFGPAVFGTEKWHFSPNGRFISFVYANSTYSSFVDVLAVVDTESKALTVLGIGKEHTWLSDDILAVEVGAGMEGIAIIDCEYKGMLHPYTIIGTRDQNTYGPYAVP